MCHLHFSKKDFDRYSNKTLLCLSVLVIIFISLYALFYQGLSFDGAFHSQAAINFYKSGKYVLDYPIGGFTQIKVPFQIVNGFFLTVFGMNFIAANLANVLFYILFGWLLFKLYKQFNSQYILIGLILISFSRGLLLFGFMGYGEIPALVLGLFGILLLTKWPVSTLKVFFGAFLIGTAIATKWVFVLILLPFGIIILLRLLNKKYKFVIYSLLGFLLSLTLFWSIEYANYSVSLKPFLTGIIKQTIPVNNIYYSTFSERLSVFWNVYVKSSGNMFVAILKIAAYLQILILFIILSLKTINKIKAKEVIRSNQLFILLISLFAIEYFLWWFFLSGKPWYRRGFNADILLIISLALSTKEVILNISLKRLFHFLAGIIISVICLFNIYEFFSQRSNELFSLKSKGAIALESEMRIGLNARPKDFNAYGYTWWQAPRWSFLSGVKHKDLWYITLEDKCEIVNGSGENFVFFEPENLVDEKNYKKIHELYKLSTIFEYNNYTIKKIETINDVNFSKIASFINYSESDYFWTAGVYSREKGFCWYSQNAKILLSSKNKTEFVLSFYIPDINKYSSPPYLSIYFNDNMVYKEKITSSGAFVVKIKVSKECNLDQMVVNVQVSDPFQGIRKREMGIIVTQIGFR
jgi:hypothetical protein